MKQAALTFAFILLTSFVFSQKLIKVVKQEFPNGQKEIEETYLEEEKPENLVKRTTYSPNGKKVREESILEGKLNGMQREWSEQGNKTFEGNYIAGKPEGTLKRWDPINEKLLSELNYTEGKPDGKQIYYFAEGETKAELNFVSGTLSGAQKEWHTPDQEKFNFVYANGIPHGQQVEYFSDGSKMFNLHFVAGKLDGIQKFYARAGANPTVETWKQGRFENRTGNYGGGQRKEVTVFEFVIENPDTVPLRGTRKAVRQISYFETGSIKKIQDMGDSSHTKIFYRNGKVQAEGDGTEDKPNGEWKWYAKEGNISKQGTYENGNETGDWIEYNSEGKELMKWTSDGNGNRTKRQVFFYFENGQLEMTGNLDSENRKDGKWEYYFEDGKRKREETYEYSCKQKGGRPYLYDYTEWDTEKRIKSAGSERDFAQYEYDDVNKLTTESRMFRPFRSPCTKGIIDYYKDGKMLRNDKLLDETTGKFVKIDSAIVVEKLVMDYSGQARSIDRYNKTGLRNGKQEAWYASGVRKYVFEYKDGVIVNEAKEWHPNGHIRIDVTFSEGDTDIPAKGLFSTAEGKEYEFEREKHKELKKKMLEIMEGSNLSIFRASSPR